MKGYLDKGRNMKKDNLIEEILEKLKRGEKNND